MLPFVPNYKNHVCPEGNIYMELSYILHVPLECLKNALRSTLMKRVPLWEDDITIFIRSLVSNMFAAGDPASPGYVSLSPPTVICILFVSDFNG